MREQDRGKIKTPFMLAFSVGAVLFSAHAGGGKAIDTCKVLAHSTNRPFFTFPTIASTCASCTSLGIVYHPDGSLREYSFLKIPLNHIFINTQIIAEAPDIYLWAGMGDTMTKHYECTISSRNDIPAHSDAMGIALSSMCAVPIMRWGEKALADCKANQVSDELFSVSLSPQDLCRTSFRWIIQPVWPMPFTMVSQYCQAQKKTVIFTARLFPMVSLLC